MLEQAKAATRHPWGTSVEYCRFADDLVVLVDAHPRQQWLRRAVERRLREELAKLHVEGNEEKSRRVDLKQGESFGFLGFAFRRIRSRSGRWMPLRTPRPQDTHGALAQTQADLPTPSLGTAQRVNRGDQPHLARVGAVLCLRPLESVLFVRSPLGRTEGAAASGNRSEAPRLRLEAVE
jgi:hypothetical protein